LEPNKSVTAVADEKVHQAQKSETVEKPQGIISKIDRLAMIFI